MSESRDGEGRSGRSSSWLDFVITFREGPDPGREYPIDRQSITLGRAPGNDILIQHPDIARYHAVMVWEGDCWVIHDLNSPVGTFVNGRRVAKRQPVQAGDAIDLGSAVSLELWHVDARPAEAVPVFPSTEEPDPLSAVEPAPISSLVGSAQDNRSKGWLLIALAVLLAAAGLLALMVVVVLSEPDARPEETAPSATLGVSGEVAAGTEAAEQPAAQIVMATPTLTPVPTETAAPAPTIAATPTPCSENSVYVEDVTLPDGSVVYSGERIDKTWRLQNTGTCGWREGYRLKYVGGDEIGLVSSVLVADTASGDSTDVAVPMFAPKTPGEHRSVWQMVNPKGETFGQPVEVVVLVRPAPTPSLSPTGEAEAAVPAAEAGSGINFWADDQSIQAGEKTTLHVVAEDVAAVWLDGDVIIGGRETREIAPCVTTQYTLDVQLRTGRHVYRTVAVDVTGVCSGTGYPELSIGYSMEPLQVSAGQTSVISYTVLNQGDAAANGFDVVFSPGVYPSERITLMQQLSLESGHGLRAVYSYTWPITGVFQLALAVDAANRVEESDEDNNSVSHVVVIGE